MAEIKLYDYSEIVESWFGTYEESFVIGQGKLSAGNIISQIDAVPENEELIVRINSVGGSVFDGWAIYNALKSHKGNVIVRIEGIAASIASIIAMSGDSVIICQAAMLMVHKPTIDPYWFGSMDAEDLKREASALDKVQDVLASIYVNKTGLDEASINSMINVETWITPAEAVLMGFADSIDQTITETSIAENSFKHIFKNADVKTKAYANKIFNKVETKNMSTQTLEAVNETLKKNNTVLDKVLNFLNLAPKPEETPEPEEIPEEEPAETPEEALEETPTEQPEEEPADVEALTARIAELEAETAEKDEALTLVNARLVASNQALESISNIQSKFVVPERKQAFDKSVPSGDSPKVDLSPEARAARRAEREEIKNQKNKK